MRPHLAAEHDEQVADDRLPLAPWDPGSDEAGAYEQFGRDGALTVLSADGVVMGTRRGVYNGYVRWLSHVALPAGTYTVRLDLPGVDPIEQDAVVEVGQRTAVMIGEVR